MERIGLAVALLSTCGSLIGGQTQSGLAASVTIDTSQVIRQIPPTLYGSNLEWVWNAYALWNDGVKQADPNLVSFASQLGVSTFRYPGGMYADFYHWQNGVGPSSSRPVVPFRIGDQDSGQILFGTDEALQFAQRVNAELLITVNVATGTAAEAAGWVRYVNAQSLRVRYWEIGNEVYINDGSTAQNAVTMDPLTYATRFLEFAQAMRAADPRIKIGAIGGQNRGAYNFIAYPNWNQVVLQTAGSEIDFLAIHNSYAPVNVSDSSDVRSVYSALMAAPTLIASNLQTVAAQVATYTPSRAPQIPVAVTEWGPLFQSTTLGRYVQHTKTLGSALYTTAVLKALVESPTTSLANFHAFNDMSIMCWICSSSGGTYPPVWTATAQAMAFQLFRQHFGTLLVPTAVNSPTYNSPEIGTLSSVSNVPYLDVVSSLSADGKTLFVIAINKHFDRPISTTFSVRKFGAASIAATWTLNGTGIDANSGTTPLQVPGVYWAVQNQDPLNPQFYNGGPGQVTVTPGKAKVAGNFTYEFPAHSVTALQLTRAQ